MQVIAGPSGIVTAAEIANQSRQNLILPKYKIFPDGESYLRLPTLQDVPTLIVQSCHYPQDTNLFQLLNLVTTIRKQVTSKITCYIPYLCYARADREVRSGEAVSIATVLNLLESVGINHLITLDIHNPDVLEDCKMETTNVYPAISIKNYLQDKLDDFSNLTIIAPDRGAIDRAKSLANEMNLPFDSLDKIRDPENGKVTLNMDETVINTSSVILVDDIISTGGTLVEASNLLKIHGVNTIHYIITHALGTQAVDKLQEIGNGLVVATNSTDTLIGHISSSTDILRVLDV